MHGKYGLYKQLSNIIQNFHHFRINIFLSIQPIAFFSFRRVLGINQDPYMIKYIPIESLHHPGKFSKIRT